jgi:photosystem II stability/assembly factor-like uncharacterized protein
MNFLRFIPWALVALAHYGPVTAAETAATASWPTMAPAARLSTAVAAPMLAAARAGQRFVAVGDHGVILLSDDGRSFRQARSVPVRALLTTVQFTDAQHGWAAGHDGVVLGTDDGGETWRLLRATPGVEQPILALHVEPDGHGIAVGLYGWAIETRDGGRSWFALPVESGEVTDRHLLHVFASPRGTLFITGEGGSVWRSDNHGRSWQEVPTGSKGSLWHGLALADGTLLACGMRGHLWRSADDGRSWQAVDAGTTQSLTGIAELADGRVVVVGMGGTVLSSKDGGRNFLPGLRAGQEALTAVLADGPRPLLLGMTGPLTR